SLIVSFFFKGEEGIRDWSVTGVQTCALPICAGTAVRRVSRHHVRVDPPLRRGRADGRRRAAATAGQLRGRRGSGPGTVGRDRRAGSHRRGRRRAGSNAARGPGRGACRGGGSERGGGRSPGQAGNRGRPAVRTIARATTN